MVCLSSSAAQPDAANGCSDLHEAQTSPSTRALRHWILPFGGGPPERTEEPAVFVTSPKTARQRAAMRVQTPWTPQSRSSAYHSRPHQASPMTEELETGIKKRTAEQMIWANLNAMAVRCRIRYGDRAGLKGSAPASNSEQRRQVVASATKFTELNARTQGILERHMTLRPPRRRHTIAFGDLRAYAEVEA